MLGDYSNITVIATRAAIGAFIGLNKSVVLVWMAEWASSTIVREQILLGSCVMYTFGAVWVPFLAYLFLEKVGWRIFIVITSVPFFIPPIFALHYFKSFQDEVTSAKDEQITQCVESENEDKPDNENLVGFQDFKARLCKMFLWKATTYYQGWGTILLLPALMQVANLASTRELTVGKCDAATKGWEFLLIALVNGAVNLGRLGAHLVRGNIKFRVVYCSLAAVTVMCYTATYYNMTNLAVIVGSNFAVKMIHGAAVMETTTISYNVKYFGTENFALGNGIMAGVGVLAGVGGTAMASFLPPSAAVLAALVIGALQVFAVLLMTEPDQFNAPDH